MNKIKKIINDNIAPIICYSIALMILLAIIRLNENGFINLTM
tara:strand:- start:381 stop:506 length:126 start_codon:yes stop_codon:yes gene_type:complete